MSPIKLKHQNIKYVYKKLAFVLIDRIITEYIVSIK